MFKEVFTFILWIICGIAHWLFLQNDFLYENDEAEEDESLEINFDISFFMCWLMAAIYMIKDIIRFL